MKLDFEEETKKLSRDPEIRKLQIELDDKTKHIAHLEKKLVDFQKLVLQLQMEKGELNKRDIEHKSEL